MDRETIDPELHTLREAAKRLDDTKRGIERARFAIYAAMEGHDRERARQWATACRASILASGGDDERAVELRRMALEALAKIDREIEA
jgi:hypothetical protein